MSSFTAASDNAAFTDPNASVPNTRPVTSPVPSTVPSNPPHVTMSPLSASGPPTLFVVTLKSPTSST